MNRKIITIDQSLCNGCGSCTTACAEGALKMVNGKARLVKESFCDGFGDCIGDCPTGALKIEERESEEFDAGATKLNLLQTQGPGAVKRMEDAAQVHENGARPAPAAHGHAHPHPHPHVHGEGGCPGSRMRSAPASAPQAPSTGAGGGHAIASDLQQWPVQIHLVQPGVPFFQGRELVVLSTCSPVASADVHWRFIRGRGVVVGCPKLDRTEGYAEKLGAILQNPTIPKLIVVRMEVPCCGGLTAIAKEAVRLSGRTDLVAEEVTVGLQGDILSTQRMN